jgi:malonyl-CoA/methylmalonyl-CoA synthetase
METWDRTDLLPSHEGQNVLPNNPFFARLLRHAHRHRIVIRDRNGQDVSKTYGDLLSDALALRVVLERTLSDDNLVRLRKGDEVYIGVLAAGGYEFTVAMVAILAIGAAVVPMSKSKISMKIQ